VKGMGGSSRDINRSWGGLKDFYSNRKAGWYISKWGLGLGGGAGGGKEAGNRHTKGWVERQNSWPQGTSHSHGQKKGGQ